MAITRVNSRDILDRTIRNVDINDNAEIADTKLATISTSGKVANSATTGTSSSIPNTIVLRDGSGNANFNAINATQSITSDTLIRSPFIEAYTSILLVDEDRTTPPVSITRNNVGAGVMSGLEYLYVNDTIFTSTIEAVHLLTTTGRVEAAPVNGTDIANKDYVDSVATSGSITGDLTAGRVVLSTGLHTISDSDLFKFDPVAKTFSIRMGTDSFPNEVGIEISDVAKGTMGLYADEFRIYAQGLDATVFTSSCPDDNVLLSFFSATPVGRQTLTDGSTSMLRRIADGLANFGLFSFGTPGNIIPTKVEEGGTGLNSLGAAFEVLRVNAGGTALEYSSAGSGDISGTLTVGRVPYASAEHILSDDAGFVYDPVLNNLGVTGKIQSANIYESAANYNFAFGTDAFNRSGAVTASYNIAIGYLTQNSIINGANNLAIGHNSQLNCDGSSNIGIGNDSQLALEGGSANIAIGVSAQRMAASAYNNVGIGVAAQYSLESGQENIAVGNSAQEYIVSGEGNIAVGYESQKSITTGGSNVCIGTQSGFVSGATPSVTNAITSGTNNTFLGYRAGFNTSTQRTNSTAIGSGAYIDADNTVALGNAAVTTIMAGSSGAARVVAGALTLSGLQSYANNAAAITGGLTAGQLYMVAGSNPRTLAIVY